MIVITSFSIAIDWLVNCLRNDLYNLENLDGILIDFESILAIEESACWLIFSAVEVFL